MKLFPFRADMDAQVADILKRINLRKNGETVALHRQGGINYQKSYGVSMNHLKEIAASIPQNLDLADRLWHRQVRETMLLAGFVCPANELSIATAVEWSTLISNSELVEQTSMNLFSKLQYTSELCYELTKSGDNLQYATALFSAGWAVRFGNSQIDGIQILSQIKPTTEQLYIPEIRRGLTHLLKQLVKSSDAGARCAQEWIDQHKNTANREVQMVVSEIDAEIAWRNENKTI